MATSKQITKPAVKQSAAPQSTKQTKLHKPSNKPTSGNSLFAYTWATMTVLGMFGGKQASRAAFVHLNGDKILSHHNDKFEVSGGLVSCVLPEYFVIGEKAQNVQRAAVSTDLGNAFVRYIKNGEPIKEWSCGKPIVKAFSL